MTSLRILKNIYLSGNYEYENKELAKPIYFGPISLKITKMISENEPNNDLHPLQHPLEIIFQRKIQNRPK